MQVTLTVTWVENILSYVYGSVFCIQFVHQYSLRYLNISKHNMSFLFIRYFHHANKGKPEQCCAIPESNIKYNCQRQKVHILIPPSSGQFQRQTTTDKSTIDWQPSPGLIYGPFQGTLSGSGPGLYSKRLLGLDSSQKHPLK